MRSKYPNHIRSADYNMKADHVRAVVKHSNDTGAQGPTSIDLTAATTVEDIEMHVHDLFPGGHDALDLVLHYDEKMIGLGDHKTSSLSDLGVELSPHLSYTITATPSGKANMSLYVNDPSEDDLLLGASASPTTGELPSSSTDAPPMPEEDGEHTGHCSRCRVVSSNEEGCSTSHNEEAMNVVLDSMNYVGLVNQAMTCYLNSLVQSLYMTPEFRNAIYNWEFDGQNETRSIPYQLQRLFLNLQTSARSAVETTDLTTSFGWQGSEAWHQHDIQELCRVMFDALERKFKDTEQANLINDLYEGKMLDYVKCLECGTEKSREDTFLDIPLPVRPFGSTVAYNSVEEALRAFVQPETLEGNNQYHCDKCSKKCDAHKGLKFMKFPYLLTLHLKRFDFDYNSMHRIKLNDKVVFPERLNLNSFVPNTRESNELEERDSAVKCDDCSTTDSGSALDDESCQGADLVATVNGHDDNCEDSDEGIDVSSGNVHHDSEAQGPYNYELFSIMIHSGSASGGHYYAYIKDFDKDQWLCFNDQSVNRITEDDIRKTYGGGPQKGYYSGMYTSSTNAYMLMYRQVDKKRNRTAIKVEDFPPHMEQLIETLKRKEQTDRDHKEKQNNSFRLTVYCYNPFTGEMLDDVRIRLYNDSTLEDAAAIARRRFKLEEDVEQEDCRMVVYNKKQTCVDCSFDGEDQVKFCDIADRCNVFHSEWLLEIKEPGTAFVSCKTGGVSMRAFPVDLESEDVREPRTVRVDVGDTVSVLRNKLTLLFGIDAAHLHVVMNSFCCMPQLLDDDALVVPFDSITRKFKLFVCERLDDDPDKKFDDSKLLRVIEAFESIVYINVLLPDAEAESLDNLFIPSLESVHCEKGGSLLDRGGGSPSLRASPQPSATGVDAFGDQSNSEDSSLSDSDRTLVGDAPGDCANLFSSSSTSPADQHMPSPMDPAEDTYNYDVMGNPGEEMHWDTPTTTATSPKSSHYFKVSAQKACRKCPTNPHYSRLCRIFVDNRTTLEHFKKQLESVVRVPKEYFKVYRHYPTPDEEWTNLSDTLYRIHDGQTVSVKLGRALAANEFTCRVYLLKPESTDTNHFLFEHIVTKGQPVGEVKREMIFKAKKQHMLDLVATRCRLREKCLKKPRKVFLDDQLMSEDIAVISSYEVYLQELAESEKVTSTNQLVLFTRHWCPSTLTLQPFQEVVLDTATMTELKTKVAEMANIPLEFVQVAFIRSVFPCDMHLLDVNADLDWDSTVNLLDQWPLHVEDGGAFFYRDSREQLKELTPEERKEINIRENTRLGRISARSGATWEKSLRIYLDNWPSENEDNCAD